MNRACASRQRCSISVAKSCLVSYWTSARSIETIRASCSTVRAAFSILTLGRSLRCDIANSPQPPMDEGPHSGYLPRARMVPKVGDADAMLCSAHVIGAVADLGWAEVARLHQVGLHGDDVHARFHGIQYEGRR